MHYLIVLPGLGSVCRHRRGLDARFETIILISGRPHHDPPGVTSKSERLFP